MYNFLDLESDTVQNVLVIYIGYTWVTIHGGRNVAENDGVIQSSCARYTHQTGHMLMPDMRPRVRHEVQVMYDMRQFIVHR